MDDPPRADVTEAVFIHVAAGGYPLSTPMLVCHPRARILPTWLGLRDFVARH